LMKFYTSICIKIYQNYCITQTRRACQSSPATAPLKFWGFRNKKPSLAARLFKPKSANTLTSRKFDRNAAATGNHHSAGVFPQNSFNGHESQPRAPAQTRAIIKRAFTRSSVIVLASYFLFLLLDFFNQLLKLFH
jgi:hypothetical protein